MKRFTALSGFVFTMLVLFFPSDGYSKKSKKCAPGVETVSLKLATLAPGISVANEGMKVMQQAFDLVGPKFGFCADVTAYFNGVMGDDPEMIKKAKAGKLDILAITLNGLPLIAEAFDILNMAYLIEDYGMFDYIMARNAPLINKVFWDNGWVSMALIISDGPHDLYMHQPYRTPDELKKNLKAANYTGGPDESFFRALGIPMIPIGPTELLTSVKSGTINSALLPSAFAAGMQLYTNLSYIIKPSVRYSTSAAILTKRKWETIPWDFRIYMAFLQPAAYWGSAGLVRDLAFAFMEAMLKHGSRQIILTPEQLKALRDQVTAYREKYIGSDKTKRELYNAVLKSIEEYKSGNPIEKQIYLADPTYRNFPDKVARIGEAMHKFMNTRNLNLILNLHRDKILERWRIYDAVLAQYDYVKTGNPKKLEEWMRSYYIPEVCDMIFTKHLDSIKRLYGSEQAVRDRLSEASTVYNIGAGFYKGFQRAGLDSNKPAGRE